MFSGRHGSDTIRDFTDGSDRIDLSAYGLTWSTLSPLASTVAGGVSLDLSGHGGGTILLSGVKLADLGDSDFYFL